MNYSMKLWVSFLATCAPAVALVSDPKAQQPPRRLSLLRQSRDEGHGGSKAIHSVSVACEDEDRASCTTSKSEDANATARARYNVSVNLTTGFAALDVRHGPIKNASRLNITAYAMGYAEGYLTAAEMAAFYPNVYEFGPSGPSTELTKFVKENDAWIRAQVASKAGLEDFWHQVGLVLARFDGLLAGYAAAAPHKDLPDLSYEHLMWMNLDGDLFDLLEAIPSEDMLLRRQDEPLKSVSPRDRQLKRLRGFRCSALFKLAANNSDILIGHTTWDTYATAAPRIFKSVDLPVLRAGNVYSRRMAFSSSPGMLGSLDDWYELSEGDSDVALVVTETSAEIYNSAAYLKVKSASALCWIRMLVANALATTAQEWTSIFSTEASGTYNNQWMVLDVTKFTPGSAPPDDTFWVLEEVPGKIVAKDATHTLVSDGYWGSYNVLAFDVTREVSGELESYKDCVRGRLFSELHETVSNIQGMMAVIGWNGFQHGISSDPMDAIMARGDLMMMPYAMGGIDAKASSAAALKQGSMVSYARAGPTTTDETPFCWSDIPHDNTPHVGHPACFDFQWGAMAPAADL